MPQMSVIEGLQLGPQELMAEIKRTMGMSLYNRSSAAYARSSRCAVFDYTRRNCSGGSHAKALHFQEQSIHRRRASRA